MGTSRCMANYLKVWLTLLLLFLAAVAEAATVSGTVVNNSTDTGRVYVGLRPTWSDTVRYGVSVQTTGTPKSAPYSIKGVEDGTYALMAFVDRTNTGVHHASDPAVMIANVTVSNGANVTQNFSISNMPTVPPSIMDPPFILPTIGGAVVVIQHEIDPSTGGIVADSYSVNCNNGSISRSVTTYWNEDSDYYFYVPVNASSLSCNVTPVVRGQAYTKSADSPAVTIGDSCAASGTCESGVTVSGKVDLSAFTAGERTGKTLMVLVNDWYGEPYFVAFNNPAAVQSYSVPGVPPSIHAMRVSAFLFDTATGALAVGYGTNERTEPQLIVNGGDNIVAPDIKIKNQTTEVMVNAVNEHWQNEMWPWHALDFDTETSVKRPVNITLTNLTGTALPAEGISFAGYQSMWVGTQNAAEGGETYNAAFTYSDNSSENYTLTVAKSAADDFIGQTFPSGDVRLPDLSNPVTGWSHSLPQEIIPYTILSSINVEGGWEENLISANTSLQHNLGTPLTVGQYYGVGTEYRDIMGDSVRWSTSFRPREIGPLVTSFAPTTGKTGAAVTINGSGFTGATRVTFNGTPVTFTVVNDSTITTTVPSGAIKGLITVTDGNGITGASTSPFEKTAAISGRLTNTSNGGINGITVRLLGTGTELQTTSATGTLTGQYTLNAVPAGIPISVKFHDGAGTYRDTYTRFYTQLNDGTGQDYTLYTTSDLASWEAIDASFTAVKNSTTGMIRGRVSDTANANLGGATLTIRSKNYPDGNANYKVIYANASSQPDPNLTATDATSGRFFVTGIEQGDMVAVFASKNGYEFAPSYFQVFSGAISQSRVIGAVMPTATLSPANGTINSTDPITMTLSGQGTFLYTTDGRNPRYFGTSVGSGGTFTLNGQGGVTVRYVIKNVAGVYSEPLTASYNVMQDFFPPNVTITPAYTSINATNYTYTNTLPLNVSFSSDEPATIYYTTNGTQPTTSSPFVSVNTPYGTSVPVSISQNLTTIRFFGVDSSNNSSPVQSVTYVLDSTPPTVSSVSDQSPYKTKNLTVTISANDLNGITGYLAKATSAAPSVSDPSWSAQQSVNVTVPTDGNYTYYAFAKDLAGNISAPFDFSFTVDTTPPAAPVVSAPANGATLKTQVLAISGAAESDSTVNIYEGANYLGSDDANAGSFLFTTPSLSEGPHVLRIFAVDRAGNISVDTLLTVSIDISAPAAPVITAPAAGATLTTTPTISGTAEAGSTVKVKVGANVVGTAVATNGSFSITTSPLNAGGVTLDVSATDPAGNESGITSRSFTVIVAPKVKVGAKEFSSLQAAYNDAATLNNAVIKLLEGTLTENVIFNRNINVTLEGGYGATYGSIITKTTVTGKMQVRAGSVRTKKVYVR